MLSRGFAQLGLTRNDVVIGVGGGMVTDVAGFAAATWHRGVPVVHVATTLLGMVDAAIGGKTGVNLPEGKNLVGAFWQPAGVVCDLDALATLPTRERRSGDGEMAKYHFLTGDDLDAMSLTDRVARCVEIKADVVASDEREGGRRALLNYGHTLAHALEIATEHRLTHGEAVGVGLVYAAELARRLDRIGAERVEEHRAVVGGTYGLPTTVPDWLSTDDLVTLMGRDKKALTGGLTFVLDGADGVEVVPDVPEAAVARRARRRPGVIPEVRTARLLLRAFTDADRPAWAAIHADPLVMATLGPLLDRRAADALLDRMRGPLGRARLRLVVRRPRRHVHRRRRADDAVVDAAVRRRPLRRPRLAHRVGALGPRLRTGGRRSRRALRVRRASASTRSSPSRRSPTTSPAASWRSSAWSTTPPATSTTRTSPPATPCAATSSTASPRRLTPSECLAQPECFVRGPPARNTRMHETLGWEGIGRTVGGWTANDRSCSCSTGRTSTCSATASRRSTGRRRWPTTWPRRRRC